MKHGRVSPFRNNLQQSIRYFTYQGFFLKLLDINLLSLLGKTLSTLSIFSLHSTEVFSNLVIRDVKEGSACTEESFSAASSTRDLHFRLYQLTYKTTDSGTFLGSFKGNLCLIASITEG